MLISFSGREGWVKDRLDHSFAVVLHSLICLIVMTEIGIMSCNFKCLNGPHRRTSFLELPRRKKVDIALIQEAHLRKDDIHGCNNKYYEVVPFAATDNKTKGVLIIVRRNLNIPILDRNGDNAGRISCMKTMVGNRKIACLSVYAPCSSNLPVGLRFFIYMVKCSSHFDVYISLLFVLPYSNYNYIFVVKLRKLW